jgi:2-iminobutanoate/2-iminopropanoate deaminase
MSLPSHHMIPGAPRPVAPFNHAVEIDGWVFITGQMPTEPGNEDAPLPDGVEAQTRRVMDNLISCWIWLSKTFYLTEFERDYEAMNDTYRGYFAEGKLPARTCPYPPAPIARV